MRFRSWRRKKGTWSRNWTRLVWVLCQGQLEKIWKPRIDSAPTSQFKWRATCRIQHTRDSSRVPVRWSLRLRVSSARTNRWLQLWIKPMLSIQNKLKTNNSRDLIHRPKANRCLKHCHKPCINPNIKPRNKPSIKHSLKSEINIREFKMQLKPELIDVQSRPLPPRALQKAPRLPSSNSSVSDSTSRSFVDSAAQVSPRLECAKMTQLQTLPQWRSNL